jgi:Na+/H+ antiporter NhaD/arsenite permease-like protein
LVLAGLGVLALVAAIIARPAGARAAVSQDWSPFVLGAGLLLIGLVADDDGLFAAAGRKLAQDAPSGVAWFLGATIMIGVVTALLNMDRSVSFLTPVLVYAARS